MSFLNFRSARRRAKNLVSIRPHRPPTPPTPGSFVSPNGEPSRAFPEGSSTTTTNQGDVEVKNGPLLASHPFVPDTDYRLATKSRDFRGGLLPTGPGRNGAGSSEYVGFEQRRNDAFVKRIVSEDVTRTPPRPPRPPRPRRTLKAAPAPIKIPTNASKVQIQRSARVSAEPRAPVNHGLSPLPDDGASIITLPGALITNVWCVQTDQPRDHRLSQRISRLDSATLPSGDFALMSSKCMGLGNGDEDSDLPPVLPPSVVKCRTINDLAKGQSNMPSGSRDTLREENVIPSREDMSTFSHQISPIPEASTPSPSNAVTPDLIKDSSTSADGGSSSPPQTLDSAPSSSSTPPSGEEITMILDVFSAPLSNSQLASEMIDVPSSELDAIEPSSLRVPLTESPDTHRTTSRSRSGSRPSLSSINNLILHPATLLPIGERRTSSARRGSVSPGSARSVPSEDADTLSALPSSLAKVHSHHISRLPSFPSSAFTCTFTSGSFQSRSGSPGPPHSPDLLDDFVIADRSGTRSKYRESIDPGSQLASRVHTSPSAHSGSSLTFPETPHAFSPLFTPNMDSARPSPLPDSSMLFRRSTTRSFRSRSSWVSQKSSFGRSVTAMASIGLRPHKRRSKKLSKIKLAKRSSVMYAVDEVPGGSSSVSECSEAATTEPSEPLLNEEPVIPGPVASDAFGPTSTTMSHNHLKPQRTKASIPPAPLARPPSPPLPPLPFPVTSVESPFVPASPSPRALPPVPQLRTPSSQHTPRPPPPSPAPPSDLSSAEPGAPPPYRLHTPGPPLDHSIAPTDNLFSTSALPARAIFYPDPRRIPIRPPLPNGPRSPYRSTSSPSNLRWNDRFRSNSSVESLSRVTLMGARDLTNSSPGSGPSYGPKFRTSPPKFKGFTLEAANWTFSPEELEAVVSRGIKQSADPSSIQLLTAQAAFTDVPAELERLIALQNELKIRYQVQARKRDALHRATMACTETLGFNSYALHVRLQELAEITANLDKTAEELYYARDQAAQLSRMLAVHSGSALAMALRKLHASYRRRVTEVQDLQEQVFALEAERDEAWAHAQLVARDLDDLNDTLRTRDSSPLAATRVSNRSSLVTASRVSSARVSKAGLRASRGLRASIQIGSRRSSYVSSAPASASDAIPPVPPIPRYKLNHIITSDLSNRGSVRLSELSSSSSDTRALAQAQADLYGYLGIDDADLRPPLPLRRSSIAVSPSAAAASPGARNNARRMSDSADGRTRAGSAIDRFHAHLESEPNALLTTFHYLDA